MVGMRLVVGSFLSLVACAAPAVTADGPPAVDPDAGGGDAGGGDGDAPSVACPVGARCQDFEDTAPGAVPGGAWRVATPNCSGAGTLAVTAATAHGGGHALEVHGGGTYCDHVFLASDAPPGAVLHVRMWVRLAAALGDGHVTFAAMADRTSGRDLRLGGQARILMWNREVDDATLPALSPTGIAASMQPAAQRWYCVEAAIDGAAGTLTTRVDGAVVPGLVIDGVSTSDIDEPWRRGAAWTPALTDLRIGWESYAGQTMTLWFDDVAVSTSPIGCG